jgi:catechol 2,3-dioxygenase-like lactoylglutathione lyase family enzyme
MRPRALWLPFEVDSVAAATAFYTDRLGLSVVDGWTAPDSEGVVLRVADAAYVELASRSAAPPAPVAVELDSDEAVDVAYRRFWPAPAPPRRYPRGHYGFDVSAPGGTRVMVWSER